MIFRTLNTRIQEYQKIFPIVAIFGPGQCGKSTLAQMITSLDDSFVFLDLEKYSDLNKLNDPELFFFNKKANKICIDGIQLNPDYVLELRPTIDENRKKGQFLILGSASRYLIRQSS